MRTLLSFALLAWLATPAEAGWISGGGELVKNKNNPWFIQNTTQVRYCIEKDATFRWSEDELDVFFTSAVAYWREEFRRASYTSAPLGPQVNVFTQTFVREACSATTDLRVQFGVLSDSQRAGLGGVDPKEHVAFTIRTDYDDVNLRGRGFLYVTPDNGPERYRGDEYQDGVWHAANGAYLVEMLEHEVGHVLGLSHFGHELMDEEFGENLVTHPHPLRRPGAPVRATLTFNFEAPRQTCDLRDPHLRHLAMETFGLPQTFDCLRFEFQSDGSGSPQSALIAYRDGTTWRSAGRIDFNGWSTKGGPAIVVKYKPEQQVFSDARPGVRGVAQAIPFGITTQLRGWFVAEGSDESTYLLFDVDPETFTVAAMKPDVGLRWVAFYAWNDDGL